MYQHFHFQHLKYSLNNKSPTNLNKSSSYRNSTCLKVKTGNNLVWTVTIYIYTHTLYTQYCFPLYVLRVIHYGNLVLIDHWSTLYPSITELCSHKAKGVFHYSKGLCPFICSLLCPFWSLLLQNWCWCQPHLLQVWSKLCASHCCVRHCTLCSERYRGFPLFRSMSSSPAER